MWKLHLNFISFFVISYEQKFITESFSKKVFHEVAFEFLSAFNVTIFVMIKDSQCFKEKYVKQC